MIKNMQQNITININYFSLILISSLIPLMFHNFQLIVGVLVNALIIYSTYKYGVKKTLPLIIMPSIAAVASGLIFGPLSIYLLYFIPAIWISNFIYSKIFHTTKFSIKGIVVGSLAKSSFLLIICVIYIGAGIVPQLFLIPMSVIQLITSLTGGFMATTLIAIESARLN